MVDEAAGLVKRAPGKEFSYLHGARPGGIGNAKSFPAMTSGALTLLEPIRASAAPARRSEEPRRGREAARRVPSPAPRTRPRPRARTRRTVLVVDDAPDTREMYGSYL